MRKFMVLFLLVVSCGLSYAVLPKTFDVTNITEEVNIAHIRLRFQIDPLGAEFPWRSPYTGQLVIGYRVYMSPYPYTIPNEEPQYGLALFSLPTAGYDVAPNFWVVKPEGLSGRWYIRVDAIDALRYQVATCNSFLWDFGSNETVMTYRSDPLFTSVGYWQTSFAIINPYVTSAVVKLSFYREDGSQFNVFGTTNTYSVSLPGNATTSRYVSSILSQAGYSGDFIGSVVISSDKPISFLHMVFTEGSDKLICVQGVTK